MKRILFLGDAGSSHLTKWVRSLHGSYCEAAVFSLRPPAAELKDLEGLRIDVHQTDTRKFSAALWSKFSYLQAMPALRKMTDEFNPHIVHAHYASSYGLMGARLGVHPLIISAWGSDVFSFGDHRLGKWILSYNFKHADRILSTSEVMRERIKQFTSKEVLLTPFGVDMDLFTPGHKPCPFFPPNCFVFGMVKSMEDIYGVDTLIRALHQLINKGYSQLRLLLVGSGTRLDEYKSLCHQLSMDQYVHFTGRVNHAEVPEYHRMMDVFVNPSITESFGVSVLEAMACAKPVIVTHVGGLKEIVRDQYNGLWVRVSDVHDLASKMELLLLNTNLRSELASNAHTFVSEKYRWDHSVQIMCDNVYASLP